MTVPPSGQLDVSKQLASRQGEDICVVAVLWRDGQCVRGQVLVELGRACQDIGVVVEECVDLRGGR